MKIRFTITFTILALAAILFVSAGASVAAPARRSAPESIVIGNPISLSGPNAQGANLSQIPSYDLWAEDVNAAGGIYVEEYDAYIPVEIKRYDDTSDIGTTVQLVERLMLRDGVDFIFPPWGTASNFAIAPLVTALETPVLGCTVGSKQLEEEADNFPYFFTVLNQPKTQAPGLVEVLIDQGIESVAIIHHTDLHGIEFAEVAVPLIEEAGIEVVVQTTYPVTTEDLSQLIREVQDLDPDGFIAFSYPPETFLLTAQMLEADYHPDFFYATVGIAFPAYRDAFGADVVEGTYGSGAWNPKVEIEGAQGYFDRHVEMFEAEPDRWASAACYATGQILQQAIEKAGTLDGKAVRDAIAEGEFETILGTVTFENQFNTTYPGTVGQWQDGEFEIVAPLENRTADPISSMDE